MADTGVKYPATADTIQETGDDKDWVNPTNVGADDGVIETTTGYAYITHATFDAGDVSYLLRATNFSMGVPSEATIDGIVVVIERHYANGRVRDEDVVLTKDGTTRVGNDYSIGTLFDITDVAKTFGGVTDKWGTTWTAAEVNASTFGVFYKMYATEDNADGFVDFIRVTVYYTAVSTVTLEGVMSGTGLSAGDLSLTLSLDGAMSGTGLMAAPLSLDLFLAGSMDGTGLMTADLTPERNLSGLTSGVGNAVADLDVQAGGATVTLEGLLSGVGSALSPLTKPAGTPPFSSPVYAITFNLTFANTTLRDTMKTDVDNWLVGKEEWGTGGNTKSHTQSGNDDNLTARLVNQNDMDALLSFIESKCESIPVQSGSAAKHWCGHGNYNPCKEIEVLTY